MFKPQLMHLLHYCGCCMIMEQQDCFILAFLFFSCKFMSLKMQQNFFSCCNIILFVSSVLPMVKLHFLFDLPCYVVYNPEPLDRHSGYLLKAVGFNLRLDIRLRPDNLLLLSRTCLYPHLTPSFCFYSRIYDTAD